MNEAAVHVFHVSSQLLIDLLSSIIRRIIKISIKMPTQRSIVLYFIIFLIFTIKFQVRVLKISPKFQYFFHLTHKILSNRQYKQYKQVSLKYCQQVNCSHHLQKQGTIKPTQIDRCDELELILNGIIHRLYNFLMGNTSPSPEDYDLVIKFNKQQWVKFATSPMHDLWKHKRTQQTVEVYKLHDIPSMEEMNIYQFRSQHEEIVKVHHLAVEMNDNMCTKYENFQVLVEHIPFRLYNFNFLDTQEAFTIFSDALRGFGLIQKHLGAVEPNQELICFNEKGRAKVWLNKKIHLNYADTPLQNDNQNTKKKVSKYVRRLYDIIEQRSKRSLLPAGLKQHFLAIEHTYQSAISFVQDFAYRNGLNLTQYLRFQLIRTESTHREQLVHLEIPVSGHNRNRSSLNVSVSEYSQPAQRILERNQSVSETPVVNQMRRILSLGNISVKKSTFISPQPTMPALIDSLQRPKSRFGNTSQIIVRQIPKISFIHTIEQGKVVNRNQFARNQSPPPILAAVSSPRLMKHVSSPCYINNVIQTTGSIHEEKHIICEVLQETSKLTSTVVTDYAVKKPEQSLFASQEMSKEVKEPQESSPKLSAKKSIIDRVDSLASKDSRVVEEDVEESFQKEQEEQPQISPSFAGVSESYHQFVSFAPTQEGISSDKEVAVQQEQNLSFKIVEAKVEDNIENAHSKEEDENISFHGEVILQEPSKSQLPHPEQLILKKESVEYHHERQGSQGIYSHDYVSVESKLDVAFRKESFASHSEHPQVEKSERTSILEHMRGEEIEKYIREKYSSFINDTQKPIDEAEKPKKHKLKVDRVVSQYERFEVKQENNHEINVFPEPKLKVIQERPRTKVIESHPKKQQDEDFLDVNFLEKSLDLKYKGHAGKPKPKQEPEQDDILNIAKLEEGLLKFSASQLTQKHVQRHERDSVSKVSIKQHIMDQDSHREEIQQIDNFSIKYIENPLQKYHQTDNYSSLNINKWENSTGFDPYYRQTKFTSSYQPQEPIESIYRERQQYTFQKKRSYECEERDSNYIDERTYGKSYLTKNAREYMEPLEEYSYNSKYRSYEFDKPRLSVKPCKIDAKFDRYVKATDNYKPTSSYEPKRTTKVAKSNRYDEVDSFAKDKPSIEDTYGNNPMLASKPSSRISYDQLRSLLWN